MNCFNTSRRTCGQCFHSLLMLSLVIFTSLGYTQDNCENALILANKKYEIGQLDEAIKLANNCWDDTSITKEQKIRAYELLGYLYVALDHPDTVKIIVEKLLKLDSSYVPNTLRSPGLFLRYALRERGYLNDAARDTLIYGRLSFQIDQGAIVFLGSKEPLMFVAGITNIFTLNRTRKLRVGLYVWASIGNFSSSEDTLGAVGRTFLLLGGRISYRIRSRAHIMVENMWDNSKRVLLGVAGMYYIFPYERLQLVSRIGYDHGQRKFWGGVSIGVTLNRGSLRKKTQALMPQ